MKPRENSSLIEAIQVPLQRTLYKRCKVDHKKEDPKPDLCLPGHPLWVAMT
jgi:hypothetical protein